MSGGRVELGISTGWYAEEHSLADLDHLELVAAEVMLQL